MILILYKTFLRVYFYKVYVDLLPEGKNCFFGIIQERLRYILVWKNLSIHRPTVIKLCGCSLSRVVLSGQCLEEQMASPRRSAFWASWVMASASSSMTNLKPFLEDRKTAVRRFPLVDVSYWVVRSNLCHYLKMVLVLAKLKIWPRTTSIPRSSDAFNCKITIEKHQN